MKNLFIGAFVFSLVGCLSGCSLNRAKTHYLVGEKLWNSGKYQAAVIEFKKAAESDPKGEIGLQALYRAGMTELLFLKQYHQAIRALRTYVELASANHDTWEAQKILANALFEFTNQYDQAAHQYEELLKANPNAEETAEFLFRLAKCQSMTGDFTQAILNFEKIENLFPEFDKFVERARFEKSVNLFLQAGKSSEDKKGESYREVNRSFDKFIEDYPESKLVPEVQFWQANSLEETDNLEGALSKYEALKDKYPQKTVIEIKLSRIKDRIKQRQHGTIK